MESYKDYYMDPNFLPQKVTMVQLREILDTHNISYTGKEKKAGLIEIFNTNIRPLIPSLREKEMKNQLKKNIATSSITSASMNIDYSKINDENTNVRNKMIFYTFGNFNPIEFITSQLSLHRRTIIIYTTVFIMFIFGSLTIYNIPIGYIQSKMVSGFCDSQLLESNETVCVPCPPNSHCSKGKITSCDENFMLASSSIHWLKPFTSRCILDLKHARKVKKYTELLKHIAIKENGNIECESGYRENLLFKNLLTRLRNEKLPLQDTDKNFEIFSQLALKNLRSDDDIKVIDEK
ncbi:4296_t:CDS:2, partial [Scutellospora calospora]